MIVDSNILIDIFNPADERSEAVAGEYRRLASTCRPVINHVILAEISPSFADLETVEHVVRGLGMTIVPFTNDDAFRAGQAFIAYRRKGGPRTAILPDFLIGAQASVKRWPIVTRDPNRFSSYFPEVELIDPLKASDD